MTTDEVSTLGGCRAGQQGDVVGQAQDADAQGGDALRDPGPEVLDADAEQVLSLRPGGDDLPHRVVLQQQQGVGVERHQLPELVDGRLDDLAEVEAGGRPPGDLVEQPRLARRLLLACEEGRIVDGQRRGVADGRGGVQLGLRERPLGAVLDQLHGADHAILDDEREDRPALEA